MIVATVRAGVLGTPSMGKKIYVVSVLAMGLHATIVTVFPTALPEPTLVGYVVGIMRHAWIVTGLPMARPY
jgi:hypothetical protein